MPVVTDARGIFARRIKYEDNAAVPETSGQFGDKFGQGSVVASKTRFASSAFPHQTGLSELLKIRVSSQASGRGFTSAERGPRDLQTGQGQAAGRLPL
jgi:hypothetical protein